MKIIGLCGGQGTGKDKATGRIVMRGGTIRKHSAVLRSMLERNGREPVPERMSALFEAIAEQLGYQWIATDVAADLLLLPGSGIAVINGIRNVAEVEHYRAAFGKAFTLVALEASEQTRFERVRNRGERPGESNMSWEEFLAIESLNANTGLADVMAMADVRINNEGILVALHEQIDHLFRP